MDVQKITALNAERMYKISLGGQSKSTEKLSSGYRINRAGDDAAGLSISEKMRSQIRGLNQASRNAQDGISLLQTAEGAMGEMHAIVHRIRELAVQAANDTNTAEDRKAIKLEINDLGQEINRIADTTQFNSMNILDGTIGPAVRRPYEGVPGGNLQIAPGYGLMSSDSISTAVITDPVVTSGGISAAEEGVLNNVIAGELVPNAVNSILSTYSFNTANLSNNIGFELYRDDSTSTLAAVAIRYSWDSSGRIVNTALQLSVNTSTLRYDAGGNLTAASKQALYETICHEMIHAVMDDAMTSGMIGTTADGIRAPSNSFPGWFKEGMAQTAAGGYTSSNNWVGAGIGIRGYTSEAQIANIVRSSSNRLSSGSTSSKYATGYLAVMYMAYMASGSSSVDTATLRSGLNTVIDAIEGGSSLSDVINNISGGTYASLSDFQNRFGDAPSAAFIKQLTTAVGSGGGGLLSSSLNGNPVSGGPATSAYYVLDVNSSFRDSNGGTYGGGGSGGGSGGGGGGGGGGTSIFKLQVGSLKGQTLSVNISSMFVTDLGLEDIFEDNVVSNHRNAGRLIEACDNAINKISTERSNIGAAMNRLEHVIRYTDNASENTQSAESRIRDVDIAEETVEYTKYKMLSQVGEEMISKANHSGPDINTLMESVGGSRISSSNGVSVRDSTTEQGISRYHGIAKDAEIKSAERLNSGYRINRAADDAAGLAISEKMRVQIRGLARASKNIDDAISLCQLADGALAETHSVLQRMNELCVQAANDTNAAADRAAIQQEIDELTKEVDRIAKHTTFNEKIYPLYTKPSVEDPTAGLTGVQYGDFYVTTGGTEGVDFEYDAANRTLKILSGTDIKISTRGTATTQDRIIVQSGVSANVYLSDCKISSASGAAFEIEDDSTGNVTVTLMGDNSLVSGGNCAGLQKSGGTSTGTLTIQGTGKLQAEGSGSGAGIGGGGRESGCNIKITGGIIRAKSNGTAAGIGGSVGIENNGAYGNGDNIEITGGDVYSYEGDDAAGIGGGRFGAGRNIRISGGYVYASAAWGWYGIGVGHAIGSGQPQPSASRPPASVYVNGVLYRGIAGTDRGGEGIDDTCRVYTYGTPTVNGDENMPEGSLWIQMGAYKGNGLYMNLVDASAVRLGLEKTLNVSSASSAGAAIRTVQAAIETVSGYRSYFGAMQNRFEHAKAVDDNMAENTQRSESRIRDTNFATEMLKHSRSRILAQVAEAMLAQANQNRKNMLYLL